MLSKHLKGHDKDLLQFGELDASLKGIKVINNLSLSAHFISHLFLDGNHLLSLTGIEQFHNLEIFHFDYNYVSLTSEVDKINNRFFMREISFIGNPIENRPEMSIEKLKNRGFTRLTLVNPPHPLSKYSHELKFSPQVHNKEDEESFQNVRVNPQQTTRRHPHYRNLQSTTLRKRMVGKIYSNKQMKTVRQEKTRAQTSSKDTKESHHHELSVTSPIAAKFKKQVHEITPFDYDPHHQSPYVQQNEYSMLKSRSGTAYFQSSQEKPTFSEQFLTQQKQRLATYYYHRFLLQKAFKGFLLQKLFQNREMEQYQGVLINDYLQTLHYSLIKLKQEVIRG